MKLKLRLEVTKMDYSPIHRMEVVEFRITEQSGFPIRQEIIPDPGIDVSFCSAGCPQILEDWRGRTFLYVRGSDRSADNFELTASPRAFMDILRAACVLMGNAAPAEICAGLEKIRRLA